MKRLSLALVALVGALAGCVVHAHPHHPAARSHSYSSGGGGRVEVVREVHVHDDSCGHVWDGGAWLTIGVGHRHYHGCGHYWYGNRWCLHEDRAVVVVEKRHTCHDGCSHYWDGGRWVVVERHRHGPRCGHVIVNGYWTLRIR